MLVTTKLVPIRSRRGAVPVAALPSPGEAGAPGAGPHALNPNSPAAPAALAAAEPLPAREPVPR